MIKIKRLITIIVFLLLSIIIFFVTIAYNIASIGFIILLLSDKYIAIIIGLINLLIYIFINIFMNLNNADIYYDKLNKLIIIKNIFNKDIFNITEFEIKYHIMPRRLAFTFYINTKKINFNYTKHNYETLVEILNIKKYKLNNNFIKETEERLSLIDFDLGNWL